MFATMVVIGMPLNALTWLQFIVSEPPPSHQPQILENLVRGTRLFVAQDLPSAADTFGRTFEQALQFEPDNRTIQILLHQRLGYCHQNMRDYKKALPHFNSAVSMCPESDRNTFKDLLYSRAECKECSGDLHGALKDYTSVFKRIGNYSSAIDNIRRLEARLQVVHSILPISGQNVAGDSSPVRDAMAAWAAVSI